METTTTRVNHKQYLNKPVKLSYLSRIKQLNEIHGVVNAVTKDHLSLIDFDKMEHIIKRANITSIIEVKRNRKLKVDNPK